MSDETRKAIVDAIRLARPAIIECYDKELTSNPDMGGRIVVDFVVTPGRDEFGHIEEAEISDSSFRQPLFEQCVLNGLAKVQFPQPPRDEPLTVSFPLRFLPKKP